MFLKIGKTPQYIPYYFCEYNVCFQNKKNDT